MMTNLAMAIPFNPLQFANRLKQAGVPAAQAEAQAEAMNDAFAQQTQVVSHLENQVQAISADRQRDAAQAATKGDIAELRAELRGEMAELRAELRGEMAELRQEMHSELALIRKEIAIARRDTIIWLGAALIAGFGVVIGLLLKLMA